MHTSTHSIVLQPLPHRLLQPQVILVLLLEPRGLHGSLMRLMGMRRVRGCQGGPRKQGRAGESGGKQGKGGTSKGKGGKGGQRELAAEGGGRGCNSMLSCGGLGWVSIEMRINAHGCARLRASVYGGQWESSSLAGERKGSTGGGKG